LQSREKTNFKKGVGDRQSPSSEVNAEKEESVGGRGLEGYFNRGRGLLKKGPAKKFLGKVWRGPFEKRKKNGSKPVPEESLSPRCRRKNCQKGGGEQNLEVDDRGIVPGLKGEKVVKRRRGS